MRTLSPFHRLIQRSSCVLAALATLPALAETTALPAADGGSGLLQVSFSLLLVVLLLVGSLYLLKRLHAPRGTAAASLRVVAGAAVGTRERVVIVEVGSTWLVLGVAAGQVSRLHEMPRPPEAETTSTANATVPAPLPDFASSLKQMLDNRHAPR
jgi:flagellar protein FliO/FliZ